MEWLQANYIAVIAAAYAILSEIIGLAPQLKSNSVIQLIMNIMKVIGGKKE